MTCRPREFMPQLDLADYPEFIAWAEQQGVTVRRGIVAPASLRSIQCMGPWCKWTPKEETMAKPVIASGDHIILDGNTRWGAHIRRHSSGIVCYTLHLNFVEALHFMLEYPKAYTYSTMTDPKERS